MLSKTKGICRESGDSGEYGVSGDCRELQRNLNLVLSISRALILWSRDDGGIPSLAAAPDGPETRP